MEDLRCVECGEGVQSLFVEFSEGNIKLTRCSSCGQVADKYIEYELILVLIDVVLHRKAAFRHIYNNRSDFWKSNSFDEWIFMFIIASNVLLQVIVLHKSHGDQAFESSRILKLSMCSVMEFLACVAGYSVICMFLTTSKPISRAFIKKLLISLAFPEGLKCVSIVLQLFDCEPNMLFLLGALTLSIQLSSVQSVTNLPAEKVSIGSALALCFRLLVRSNFLSVSDLWSIGIIS